jgi:hypothetical protein
MWTALLRCQRQTIKRPRLRFAQANRIWNFSMRDVSTSRPCERSRGRLAESAFGIARVVIGAHVSDL